jgi:hypothetical protein
MTNLRDFIEKKINTLNENIDYYKEEIRNAVANESYDDVDMYLKQMCWAVKKIKAWNEILTEILKEEFMQCGEIPKNVD